MYEIYIYYNFLHKNSAYSEQVFSKARDSKAAETRVSITMNLSKRLTKAEGSKTPHGCGLVSKRKSATIDL